MRPLFQRRQDQRLLSANPLTHCTADDDSSGTASPLHPVPPPPARRTTEKRARQEACWSHSRLAGPVRRSYGQLDRYHCVSVERRLGRRMPLTHVISVSASSPSIGVSLVLSGAIFCPRRHVPRSSVARLETWTTTESFQHLAVSVSAMPCWVVCVFVLGLRVVVSLDVKLVLGSFVTPRVYPSR